MKSVFCDLWNDDYGVILSAELVIIGSVLTLGVLTGMVSLQTAVNEEMTELGGALTSLDQSYSFSGVGRQQAGYGCGAVTCGSSFQDANGIIIQGSVAGHAIVTAQGCAQLVGCPCGDYGSYAGRNLAGGVGHMKITEYPLSPAPTVPHVIIETESAETVIEIDELLIDTESEAAADADERFLPQYWATHRTDAGAPYDPKFGTFSNEILWSSGRAGRRFQPKVIVMPGALNMPQGCPGMCPTELILQDPCGSCSPCLTY